MATADPASTGSPTAATTSLAPAASTGAAPAGAFPGGFPDILISDKAAHEAQVFVGVTGTLLALCIITFCTRLYQRVRPVWKVGLDDYFIVAGFVSSHRRSVPKMRMSNLPTSPLHYRSSWSPTGPCSCPP